MSSGTSAVMWLMITVLSTWVPREAGKDIDLVLISCKASSPLGNFTLLMRQILIAGVPVRVISSDFDHCNKRSKIAVIMSDIGN